MNDDEKALFGLLTEGRPFVEPTVEAFRWPDILRPEDGDDDPT